MTHIDTPTHETSAPAGPGGALARLADLAYRRRGTVVLAWIAALAAVIALVPRIAGEFSAEYSTPGSESKAAADLLAERFPGTSGDAVNVVWRAPAGVDDPAVAARMRRFLDQAGDLPGVAAANPPRVSPDGTIAVARLDLDRPGWDFPASTARALIDRAETASGPGLQVELGGPPIRNAEGGTSPEAAGIVVAALILVVAFGSVIAAGLPIVTALFSLAVSATAIGALAAVIDVPEWAPAVAGLIGIGVGVDYALLIVTRFRTALARGADPRGATIEAVATAGRSALVAGGTVVISLLGLFLMGVSYLRGVGASASVAVLAATAASVTLLPALLAFAGDRVDRLRVPRLGRTLAEDGRPSLAARWSGAVQRRPLAAAIAGAGVLVALTAPALGLRLGFPDEGNDAAGTTTRAAYDLVSEGFGPGANGPLLLAVDLRGADAGRALDDLAGAVRTTPGVAFVADPRTNAAGDAAIVTVVPTTSPQDARTPDLVQRLRDDVLPAAERATGADVHVGGTTAVLVDQADLVVRRLPLFIAAVVGLSFALLLAAFRSPVIALKAGLMNVLSIGAAYGVVALVAEGGPAGAVAGIDTDTPVPPFIPVMMFAVLFGLSMDYEVFLLSRVREEYLRGGDTAGAVSAGLAKTARVITAAAAIMVGVFLAFVLSDTIFLRLLGVGMATAVLVDATVVRLLLVPALMQLMGRANWWIPAWADRLLPRLDVEPAALTRHIEGGHR